MKSSCQRRKSYVEENERRLTDRCKLNKKLKGNREAIMKIEMMDFMSSETEGNFKSQEILGGKKSHQS